ncbi:hypothetical protein E7Z54_09060 [Nocardioides sp.]|uniref:hypothetical protein n=1 Tax=Nocardioides sp. TaxID=35761 RepID=UPI0010A2B869|nr:hypothetical protein [Nocardioides sp.]THJ04155.1 hypothetical protein E7Z54_09060 [Nocardioides sp.]
MKRIVYAPLCALILLMGGVVAVTMTAPASASDHRTPDMICHPVNGQGETKAGYNLISPDQASSHIDEETGAPKHEAEGRVDVVLGDDLLCPGEQPAQELCPEGTDNAGQTIPEGQTEEEFCDDPDAAVCPEGTDNAGQTIPEGQTEEEFCDDPDAAVCPDGTDNAGQQIPVGQTAEEFCDDEVGGVDDDDDDDDNGDVGGVDDEPDGVGGSRNVPADLPRTGA